MKIGIVTSYASNHPAGLERFLLDLLGALDRLSGAEYVVYTKKGTGLETILKKNNIFNIDVVEVGFGKFWKDLGIFFAPRVDAYIFNGPIVPVFFAPKNYFVILHDFAYKYIRLNTWREKMMSIIMDILTHKLVHRAKKVITVSDTTKQELIKLFGGDKEKIKTIYPGFKQICKTAEESTAEVVGPYFLYVGTLKERKNALSVVRAFSLYKKNRSDRSRLVIVGKKNLANPYVRKLLEVVDREGIINDVIFTGHISDGQLSSIYKHAIALVFPSLIEGFGFPILEAMDCGVPVITSKISSLAEIGGDAALLVDPLNIGELEEAMKKIVDNEQLRKELISKGINRSKIFSWQKTAQELQQLIINNVDIV